MGHPHILLNLLRKLINQLPRTLINEETRFMLIFFVIAKELPQNAHIIRPGILSQDLMHAVLITGHTFGMLKEILNQLLDLLCQAVFLQIFRDELCIEFR